MSAPSAARIESLDQFRGYTVAGMLLVNFGGGFAALPAVLKHHNTYCSYADTIMPQFFFAVGFALRLVLLRNIAGKGAPAAYRRTLRRIGLLILLGVVFYNLDGKWLKVDGWGDPQWRVWLVESFWRNSFQTLVHIGVTCLWVLPFIARPTRIRLWVAAFSGAAHLGLSAWFWYAMLHEKRVIDGGPLGFLTWTIPMVAGSIGHDWWRNLGPRGALRPLVFWGFAAMLGGYALSCLGVGGPLAAFPFLPPPGGVDLWTMSQRAGSLSYLLSPPAEGRPALAGLGRHRRLHRGQRPRPRLAHPPEMGAAPLGNGSGDYRFPKACETGPGSPWRSGHPRVPRPIHSLIRPDFFNHRARP